MQDQTGQFLTRKGEFLVPVRRFSNCRLLIKLKDLSPTVVFPGFPSETTPICQSAISLLARAEFLDKRDPVDFVQGRNSAEHLL